MYSVNARNRCCRCRHEWRDHPAGYARHSECPQCGSFYWEWLDYADPDDVDAAEPRSGRPRINLAS